MRICSTLAILLWLCWHPQPIFCQKSPKVQVIEHTATVEVLENMTVKQAKELAKQTAITDGLNEAFGAVVVDGTSIMIENVQTHEQTTSVSIFNKISDVLVNGEVTEIIGEPEYKDLYEEKKGAPKGQKTHSIQCTVKFKAREIAWGKPQFEALTLDKPEIRAQRTEFRHGDDIFLSFRSPVSGFLAVYAIDGQATAQQLLPYPGVEGLFPVKLDQPYILFSKKNDYKEHPMSIEGYQTLLAKPGKPESWVLAVLFSTQSFAKPLADPGGVKDQILLPPSLSFLDFHRWLSEARAKSPDLQIMYLPISIID